MYISDDIFYAGVNDHEIDLFEGQYKVDNGMAYNSYIIIDEKTAVMDTVDAHFTDEWLDNISKILDGRKPDYLIVQHMEPDHSGSLKAFTDKYKDTKIVASAKAFVIINQFFGCDFADRQVVAGPATQLVLGTHTLSFVPAPMVHWPEVIVTYDSTDKVLFSADAFGKFGALDVEEKWEDEARRYYIGIVGKYGIPVQTLLKKASALDIQTICSLHGPVLKGEEISKALALYDTWSSYKVETDGILVAYASIYGHTKEAAKKLYDMLKSKGCENVDIVDLARDDMSECVAKAFQYGKLVLASSTYNGDVFPFMRIFLEQLTERAYKNRSVAFIENGSWAPMAANVSKKMLEKSNDITIVDPTVTIKGSLNAESEAALVSLVDALI